MFCTHIYVWKNEMKRKKCDDLSSVKETKTKSCNAIQKYLTWSHSHIGSIDAFLMTVAASFKIMHLIYCPLVTLYGNFRRPEQRPTVSIPDGVLSIVAARPRCVYACLKKDGVMLVDYYFRQILIKITNSKKLRQAKGMHIILNPNDPTRKKYTRRCV